MRHVLAVILGGGRGTRLFPLTSVRSKPAVPLGGKYRLVDIPISNCLNSGIRSIFVVTQFNSQSLNRHVSSYHLDPFSGGFIEILAAQQTLENAQWYQGTADAVRQNLRYFDLRGIQEILILSGDQLYQMDFHEIIALHRATNAEITISAVPIRREEAHSFGILQASADRTITRFVEKPKDPKLLDELAAPAHMLREAGAAPDKTLIASMGIYVFKKEVLEKLLSASPSHDFGKEIIPRAISQMRVMVFPFTGYWEDIGTIKAFHRANLDLISRHPPFSFYNEERKVFTRARHLPSSKLYDCTLHDCLIADGSIVEQARIEQTIVGVRTMILAGAAIRRSVLMGSDFYETEAEKAENHRLGRPNIGIGPGCTIDDAIIDKNARIGANVSLVNRSEVKEKDGEGYFIRDGIIVVPKNAVIKDGTKV